MQCQQGKSSRTPQAATALPISPLGCIDVTEAALLPQWLESLSNPNLRLLNVWGREWSIETLSVRFMLDQLRNVSNVAYVRVKMNE